MTDMYEKRRRALRTHLQDQSLSAVLVTDPANVFYFTGFNSDPHERFLGLYIEASDGKTILFTPALDKDAAAESSDIETIVPISDEQLPFDVIRSTVGQVEESVGIEAKAFSYFRYNEFRTAFPNADVVDVQSYINKLRKRKTREEIAALKKPIEIIERVLEEGIQLVKVGMTESELTAELEYLMRKFGADGPSFSSIVLSGEKAALPHGEPGERKLQVGDYLLIDFGVAKDGYMSDTTRTFMIGEATERQHLIYDTVLASNQAGIQAVQAGIPLKTFDIAARSVIQEAGFGEYFNNRVGHGLGIEVHEEPSIHMNNEEIAEPGLVFTIEPGIYIPGEGGVRIEDTVYINEDGEVEVLSTFPRELRILG
ncbi:M24 family metallopeptidase [Sporosarcina gallistercoris]|uniref:Aminopeptidase P family protein n=1 Tax=Sporosarcina gallistercoris TaxID=2762245 RepID=A0ABR8PMD2_9BACL|nr:Xaa-Pro peptidase family protein [Sporosarcina gallistercoris]MBD7909336.1 aminopeptidase P family protein [Sporosarcina gallistercoris]